MIRNSVRDRVMAMLKELDATVFRTPSAISAVVERHGLRLLPDGRLAHDDGTPIRPEEMPSEREWRK